MAANLCDYLDASAARWADRPAVVDPSGASLTYAELDARANRVAAFLIARGVTPGDRVGVVAPKSVDVVATFFGIMKAGAAYVPADYTAPLARTHAIMADCAVAALFLDPSVEALADSWEPGRQPATLVHLAPSPEGGSGDDGPWTSFATVLETPPSAARRYAGATQLAYILYTSGSTGVPKGVSITHENATSFVDWCSDEFRPVETDRVSSHAPFHFDLSIFDIYVSIKHGATLYLVSESLGKTPQELGGFIAAHRLTIWYSTPSILSLLAQFGGLGRVDCTSLRLVLFAGEVFPVKHLRDITGRWPQAAFYNLYGPTETNVCTFAEIPLPVPPDRTIPYPIGWACPHCDAAVLDTPGGVDVPQGEEGLLHIAGPAVFPGYFNRPEPAAFHERDGKRWYNTGDVVREQPGEGYVYVGRRDRMIKRRGYRIELAEIERGLYRHEGIREAAAVTTEDAAGVKIVAFVTPQPGTRPSIIALKTFCASALPAYMNPDVFMVVDALPRTSTNKVDYQRLQANAAPPQRQGA